MLVCRSTSSRSRSTTPTPPATRSPSSRARSPTPTAPTGRSSSTSRAGPATRRRGPRACPPQPGWLDRALKEFRVLLLDQRGTGRSAPVGRGRARDRLRHFRADSIVRDAEALREALGRRALERARPELRRLLRDDLPLPRPRGLREAFITGGLPPVGRHIDDVYRPPTRACASAPAGTSSATRERPRSRSATTSCCPSGDRLTARRLAQLGLGLGMSAGAERLHHLLELPPDSPAFLHDAEAATPFARNPIFAVLHEACYADGGSTRWSAERLRPGRPRCSPASTSSRGCSRTTARWRRCARPPTCSPHASGRASTTRTCCAPTRSRWRRSSTPTTCTSSGPSRRRPPR